MDEIFGILRKKPTPKTFEPVALFFKTGDNADDAVEPNGTRQAISIVDERDMYETVNRSQLIGHILQHRNASRPMPFEPIPVEESSQQVILPEKAATKAVVPKEKATQGIVAEGLKEAVELEEEVGEEEGLEEEEPGFEYEQESSREGEREEKGEREEEEEAIPALRVHKGAPKKRIAEEEEIPDFIQERLPEQEQIEIRLTKYYLNNRKITLEKLAKFFHKYKEEYASANENLTCEKQTKAERFELMAHQKIVRDYLNLMTPYRGLLLYFGLGSGKSCSSIAIAEGMKTAKEIILLTPASLRSNFFTELKKCGDPLIKVNQFWEFISTEGQPDLASSLSAALSLDMDWIKKNKGAWLMDIQQPPNFASLSQKQQNHIQEQLDEMIRTKYIPINYNANNVRKKLTPYTLGGTVNPFDNKVVIIDEAHNFVSKIVNKLKYNAKTKRLPKVTTDDISWEMYQWLMSAIDARIVLLSGTPIINTPNEIAVLYNLLRGYIQTWEIPIRPRGVVTKQNIIDLLKKNPQTNLFDYVDIRANNTVILTRNPFGFANVYEEGKSTARVFPKESLLPKKQKEGKTVQKPSAPVVLKKKDVFPKEGKEGEEGEEKEGEKEGEEREEKEGEKEGEAVQKPVVFPKEGEGEEEEEEEEEGEGVVPKPSTQEKQTVFPKEGEEGEGEEEETVVPKPSTQEKQTVIPKEGEKGVKTNIPKPSKKTTLKKTKPPKEPKPPKPPKESNKTRKNKNLPLPPPPQPTEEVPPGEEAYVKDYYYENPYSGGSGGSAVAGGAPGAGYKGVELNDTGNVDDRTFIQSVLKTFAKANLNPEPYRNVKLMLYTSLPDNSEEFNEKFVDSEKLKIKNQSIFQKRILGLTSFFKSEQENLLPKLILSSTKSPYHFVKVSMSDHQYDTYVKVRGEEVKKDKAMKKKGPAEESGTSTYRIYSRIACNFAFPPEIPRPHNEDMTEGAEGEEDKYSSQITEVLEKLKQNSTRYLSGKNLKTYSPKFLEIITRIRDPAHIGKHLIYSQFRHLEGIGIFKMVLEENGFAPFRIFRNTKNNNEWEIVEPAPEDVDKPKYILYTGTESAEEKEVLLHIYNGNWNLLSRTLTEQLAEIRDGANNVYGKVIKAIMITQSGAEGINLKNTRYVHIIEPYWNMVRIEQVVGRARRICSHQDLPKELQTVQVFFYLSVFSQEQIRRNRSGEGNKEIDLRDVSKRIKDDRGFVSFTTDQTLLENAEMKNEINQQFLQAMKETSIECSVYNEENESQCFTFKKSTSDQFAFNPSLPQDENEIAETIKVKKKLVRYQDKYAVEPDFAEKDESVLYDLAAYKQGKLQPVGTLKNMNGTYELIV